MISQREHSPSTGHGQGMRAGTCVVLVALGHLAQQVGNGRGDGLGAVPQVLGALLHLQGEQGLHPTQTAPKPRAQHPVCPLTVSPGRGLSLPSLAAALASCRSLSRLCTKPRAESISRGPQASCACGGEKEERFCRSLATFRAVPPSSSSLSPSVQPCGARPGLQPGFWHTG